MSNHPTEEGFLKDVANHQMLILLSQGVYRHVRFMAPNTGAMHFDLITVPGKLIYTGDMGTFVFSRLMDMFEFFRTDRKDKAVLHINKGYWAEKLIATDSNGANSKGAQEHSSDKIRRVVWDEFKAFVRDECRHQSDKDQRRECWERIEGDILNRLEEGDESGAIRAAMLFSHTFKFYEDGKPNIYNLEFQFIDFWDHDFYDYTYHFVWACYAIAWGVKQWDDCIAAKIADEKAKLSADGWNYFESSADSKQPVSDDEDVTIRTKDGRECTGTARGFAWNLNPESGDAIVAWSPVCPF